MHSRRALVALCAAIAVAALVAVPVRANFGFEVECGMTGVNTGSSASKTDAKWPKAVLSAAVPANDYVNGEVKETIDDAPLLVPTNFNYLRLEYVVGGPNGMAVAAGTNLCPTLTALLTMTNVRWFHAQKCINKGSQVSWKKATAHHPGTGAAIGDVTVAMPNNQCTPQVTLGIPFDSVFAWLHEVTNGAAAAHLALVRDATFGALTTGVDADVNAAMHAVATTAPAPANGGARLKALLWFVRRYVVAFGGHASVTYLKQNTGVLMRTNFAALMHYQSAAEQAVLAALQVHYHNADATVTDPALSFCKLAWGAASAVTCARKVVTAPVQYGGGGPDITVHQWLTQLMANVDPYAGASGGSMGHIAYNPADSLLVMEFRQTLPDASPGHIAPWAWSVYDYAAQFIAHHAPVPGPAPAWQAQPPHAAGCALPSEVAPPAQGCDCTGGSCVVQFLETRVQRKALRRVGRAPQ